MKYSFTAKSSHKLDKIKPIKQNPYCSIYYGCIGETPVIIKEYRENSFELVANEANAMTTYSNIVTNNKNWMPCRVVESKPQENLLIISFMPGSSLSTYIYNSFAGHFPKKDVLNHVQSLGSLLREIYFTTQKSALVDSFFANYATYCVKKLQKLPSWKKKFLYFDEIFPEYKENIEKVSFVHGDFVPANIHIHQDKVGVIDFANSNYCSTISNDIYNFKLAIYTMFISKKMKQDLMEAFYLGLGEIPEDCMKSFFSIYHRNRWLMLKTSQRNPLSLLNVFWNRNNIRNI